MANTRNPARTDLPARLIDKVAQRVAACAAFVVSGEPRVIAIALSGGRDSAALLHAAAAWRDSADMPMRLVALHVHHGLQPDANAWERACARMAAGVRADFHARRVQVPVDAGRGIEEAAREVRYAALVELCVETGATLLLTAHHQDDQAETVLLQLLRGAGLEGLAAMPLERAGGVTLLRPWLDVPRGDIETYARAHALAWVDDPSNDDARYARNALRPLLAGMAAHFPAYRASLARSAAHLADAAALIEEVARADLAQVAPMGVLAVTALEALSVPRQRTVLRAWLASAGQRAVSARRLEDLRAQLLNARADGALCLRLPGAQVRRYRGAAWIETAGEAPVPSSECVIDATCFDPARLAEQHVDVSAWGGALRFLPAETGGLDPRILRAPLLLAARRGGERIVLRPGGPSRALKQAYQEAGIPAWARPRLPLLYAGAKLVFAAGLGIDRSAGASPGWQIVWQQTGEGKGR